MSSLVSRGAVLAFARLMQQAVMMLSPIMLVRLMSVADYGRYRQFVVLAMFAMMVAEFSVPSSVNYFVARSSEHAAAYVTNAVMILLLMASIAATAFLVAPDALVPVEIRDYSIYLAVYVFLLVNLDIFTAYCVATRRATRILYYSVGLTATRLAFVAISAWLASDLASIFRAMIAVECLNVLGVLAWMIHARLFDWRAGLQRLREQLHFILPTGGGHVLSQINDRVGSLVVGSRLGAESLALYTIASFKMPIIGILKSGLSDAIFPDLVERSKQGSARGLELWRRSNIVFLMLVAPVCVLLMRYAEVLIRLLFTEAYVAATPYFLALLPLMIRECFDFSTPLRGVGNTRPFVISSLLALALNVGVIVIMLPTLGLWSVILGLWAAKLLTVGYLGRVVLKHFDISLAVLLDWRACGKIIAACVIAFLALLAVEGVARAASAPDLVSSLGAVIAFGVVYSLAIHTFGISEARVVLQQLSVLARGRLPWRSK